MGYQTLGVERGQVSIEASCPHVVPSMADLVIISAMYLTSITYPPGPWLGGWVGLGNLLTLLTV